MANTYLTRTASGTDGTYSQKRNTISMWLKRSSLSDACFIEGQGNDANATQAYFDSNTNLTVNHVSGNSSLNFQIVTNRKFRDTSAWYHFVITIDTTLGTAADRVKIYVNGVRETSFSSASYPGQNATTQLLARLNLNIIGRRKSGGVGLYFDGSMSHVHVTDGTAYQASSFGSVDSVTGEWQINTSPNVTYGNNGFFILKDGNTITDSSPNSNNFSLGGGTLTKTEDSPSNVFATLNPLNSNIGATIPTLSMGNNRTSNSIANKMQTQYSTLAPANGKFYCEVKATAGSVFRIGISSYNSNQAQGSSNDQNRPGQFSEGWGYDKTGTIYKTESSIATYTSYATGNIICIALDMTNKKLYFKRNANAWENSANPATGSNGIDISSIPSGTGMAFGAGLEAGSGGAAYADFNFGNGYFGTTAVSSAGTNASGNGIFEYDVPSGYTALSTKGLNT